jgi:hypothetical protein
MSNTFFSIEICNELFRLFYHHYFIERASVLVFIINRSILKKVCCKKMDFKKQHSFVYIRQEYTI